MFHVVIILIATCFGCTLYHFYAFSGTNLLTRCHSASSLFFAVFRFRNPIKEIFSESDEINYAINKRSGRSRSPEGTWRGPPGSHAIGGRGPGGTRTELWRGGPTWPPTPPLRLYIPRVVKTLKIRAEIPRKVPSRLSSLISDRRSSEALPSTLPEGRSSPEASTLPSLPSE